MSRDVHSCIHWMRHRNSSPPPHFWTRITRALLVSKDRFVTLCVNRSLPLDPDPAYRWNCLQMSRAVHITWHGAQINFGDLPPYLTYVIEPSILNKCLSTKINENYVVLCIRQEELMKIFSILFSHKYFPNFCRRANENIYLNFPLVHSWRSALSDSHWQIISEGKICADFGTYMYCTYVCMSL